MKKRYNPETLADRYNIPVLTVINWIEDGYLKATLTKRGYVIKEKAVILLESIPPYRYEPQKEEHFSEDIGEYISYGIKVSEIPGGKEVTYVCDVSTDKERIEELCRLATDGILDPIQLSDVIEDFVYS